MAANDNATIGDGSGSAPTGTATVTGSSFSGNNAAAELNGGTGAAGATTHVYYRFVNNGTALEPNHGYPHHDAGNRPAAMPWYSPTAPTEEAEVPIRR